MPVGGREAPQRKGRGSHECQEFVFPPFAGLVVVLPCGNDLGGLSWLRQHGFLAGARMRPW